MLLSSADQSAGTRERILRAASLAFAADGFRATTVRSIAHSAGVNEVTVYRHFAKKELMYWAVIDSRLRTSGILEFLFETSHKSLSPRELFTQLGVRLIDAVNRDPGLIRLLHFAMLELRAERSLLLKTHFVPMVKNLRSRIEARMHDGAISPNEVELAVVAFLGVLFTHISLAPICGLEARDSSHPELLAAEYANLCITGLKLSPQH